MNLLHLFNSKNQNPVPVLKAIYIADSAGQPMQNVDSIYAVCGRGLQGDRYHDNNGHWKATDGCQLTMITNYEIELASKQTNINLDSGAHRRNLVIDGIRPKELKGKHFSIGQAIFAYDKPRPPCGYIDRVEGKGIGRALRKGSGACLSIIESGTIRTGDRVTILPDH